MFKNVAFLFSLCFFMFQPAFLSGTPSILVRAAAVHVSRYVQSFQNTEQAKRAKFFCSIRRAGALGAKNTLSQAEQAALEEKFIREDF